MSYGKKHHVLLTTPNFITLGRVHCLKTILAWKFPYDISIQHCKSQDPKRRNWKFGFGTGLENVIEESDW